ncbi:DNA-directed RNA polymerase subunit H [Candidatus Pacearchaeota archaeon]|nr:DNA-directed RNA polymerase subunit H [Candidatus Pacearchaeota archaeon]
MTFATTMHTLQPKHIKLKSDEVKQLLESYNISVSQLPKIKSVDVGLPEGCQTGDVIKIERNFRDKNRTYFRVVV